MRGSNLFAAALVLAAGVIAAAPGAMPWAGSGRGQAALGRCGARPEACLPSITPARIGDSLPAAFRPLDPIRWAGLPEPGPGRLYYVSGTTVALVDADSFTVLDLLSLRA
jgi:hypothetical protein